MIDRRKFISTTASFAATAAAAQFVFAEGKADNKGKPHSHGQPSDSPYAKLAATSADCVAKGEACLQHCMDLLLTGDTSMADCSKTVREMLIYCQALSKAAAMNSKYTPQLAKIAAEACANCEKECRKHAEHHTVCKECAESCAECLKHCKSISA